MKTLFACKTKGDKSYGRCAAKDDLTSIFKKVEEEAGGAIILGSPVYYGTAYRGEGFEDPSEKPRPQMM